MSSSRFPGKVLTRVGGRPLLDHLMERLGRCRSAGRPIVLTSTDPSDDVLADHCRKHSIEFFRGPLEDVAGRFCEAIQKHGLKDFIRVSADSPLLDPELVDLAANTLREGAYDVVTDTLERRHPKGQSVEAVRSEALLKACAAGMNADEKEHVTRYFYNHPSQFRIFKLPCDGDFSAHNFCVDYPKDLDWLEPVLESLGERRSSIGW